MNIEKLLIDKVKKTETCWLWTGDVDKTSGYGRIAFNKKRFYAHRVFYSIFKGKIGENLCIDHICRVRNCVNPEHLRAVTKQINTIENSIGAGAINRNKTHCKNGHEFNKENTYYIPKGNGKWRACKECSRQTYKNKIKKNI